MKKVIIFISLITSIFILSNKVYAYKIYKISDEVIYNDIDFYVIKDSSSDEEIVTLLKAEPLTVEEVNTYGEGQVNNYVTNDTNDPAYKKATNNNGYGGIRYYCNINCGINSQNVWVYDECDSDYEKSDIKIVVDNWVNDKKIQNLKAARLITIEEISNLGYEYFNNGSAVYWKKNENTPIWVYNSNYWYWTMSHKEDSNFIWRVSNSGDVDVSAHGNGSDYYAVYGTVRPVVELYKCAIDNSCDNNDNKIDINNKSEDNKETEKLDINNNKNETKTKVSVPNTLKSVSGLVILIGMVLVCVGLNIFIIIKNKDRKKD